MYVHEPITNITPASVRVAGLGLAAGWVACINGHCGQLCNTDTDMTSQVVLSDDIDGSIVAIKNYYRYMLTIVILLKA